MSWLETQDEQEVELPDLSNEPANEVVGGPSEGDVNNAPVLDNVNVDSSGQPLPPEVPAEEIAPQPVAPAPANVPVAVPTNPAR